MKTLLNSILVLLIAATTLSAQDMDHNKKHEHTQPDKEKLVKVLNDFRKAIISNDSEKAADLLSDNARILESGGIETKEEYLSHHFHSDGKFLSAMEREVRSQEVKSSENTAWISTVSHMSGTYNEKDISISSAELAVLVKTEDGWKISAVHWSSRDSK